MAILQRVVNTVVISISQMGEQKGGGKPTFIPFSHLPRHGAGEIIPYGMWQQISKIHKMRSLKNREILRLKNIYNCFRWGHPAKLRVGAFGLSCISAIQDGYPRAARKVQDPKKWMEDCVARRDFPPSNSSHRPWGGGPGWPEEGPRPCLEEGMSCRALGTPGGPLLCCDNEAMISA